MSIQPCGPFMFPMIPVTSTSAPALTTSAFVLDASGEKAALVFRPSESKALHKIHVRTGTTTTGDTLDVRAETVDASGDPSGTLVATNTNGGVTLAGSDDNVWKTATLTADASLTRGSAYALVVVNGGGGGNFQLGSWGFARALVPYGDLYTGTWAKSANCPVFLGEYDDGTFVSMYGFDQVGAITGTTAFNTGTGVSKRGNKYTPPIPMRVSGGWAWLDQEGPAKFVVYAADGTTVVAESNTIPAAERGSTSPAVTFFPFLADADLDAGTVYYLAVVPTSTTSLSVYHYDVPAVAVLDLWGGGQALHMATWDGSAWTATTTARLFAGLVVTGLDDGAGGGGGLLTHPGMTGGIRG